MTPKHFARAPSRWYLLGALAIFIVFIFYFWHISSLTPGLSPQEGLSRQNSQTFKEILKEGVNAPYYLVQHILVKLHIQDALALRLTSVLFSLVIFGCLFSWLHGWFGKITTFFTMLIFISTPWVILTGRSASPAIMWLWPVVLTASYRWLARTKQHGGALFILFCAGLVIALYTPGLIWLLAAAAIAMRRTLRLILKRPQNTYVVGGILLGLLALVPLIVALVDDPSRLKNLLLIPNKWASPLEELKSIAWSFLSLFWGLRTHVDIALDKLPILNIMQVALCAIGIYALSSAGRRILYFMLSMLVFAVFAAGLNHNLNLINIGLPAMAVFLAAGLRYLYLEWRRIFPFNPFSYALAISLITLVALTQLLYGARYSLIAWPHSPDTKTTYVLK